MVIGQIVNKFEDMICEKSSSHSVIRFIQWVQIASEGEDIKLHYINYITLHYIILHFKHYIKVHHTVYITLHYTTLNYITLYITLHYSTLH